MRFLPSMSQASHSDQIPSCASDVKLHKDGSDDVFLVWHLWFGPLPCP